MGGSMLVLLVACGEPEERCELWDPGDGCAVGEICCTEDRDPLDVQCAYVTRENERFECLSSIDCTKAADAFLCEVCSVETTYGAIDRWSGCDE